MPGPPMHSPYLEQNHQQQHHPQPSPQSPEGGLHHVLDERQLALRHRRALAVADERDVQPQPRLPVACRSFFAEAGGSGQHGEAARIAISHTWACQASDCIHGPPPASRGPHKL